MSFSEIALTFLFSRLRWPKNGALLRKCEMDGSRYINECEGAKCCGRGRVGRKRGSAEKRSKNRMRSRKRERSFVAGTTRIGSRVRSIVNHGGRGGKKLPLAIAPVRLCVRVFVGGHVYPESRCRRYRQLHHYRHPLTLYCIGALLARTDFRCGNL